MQISHTLGLFLQYHNKDNYVDSCGVGQHTDILSLSSLINVNSRFFAVIPQPEPGLKTECSQNNNSALFELHGLLTYTLISFLDMFTLIVDFLNYTQ